MWHEVADRIEASLAGAALDLVAPFGPGWLTLIVGNSRALWPRFLAWLAADPARAAAADPIESYVEEAVGHAAAASGVPCVVRFAHDGPPWPPIQRLAEQAGLAWLAPSNLSIHPVLGPWISLRAIIVAGVEGPTAAPRPPPPCAACPHACLPAFGAARAALDPAAPAASSQADWRAWLAVRDACPIGRAHRFQEDHIEYGYTKERGVLRRAITPRQP